MQTIDPAPALRRAHDHALSWLASLADRPVPATATVEEVTARLGDLPEGPSDPVEAVDHLVDALADGLVAMPSGRFFGFVIGGSHPAALGADWLTSAWDQNASLRLVTPGHSAVEDVASRWLLDLLDLPVQSAVGFVTGATMSNFTCLAAARDEVLRRAGWDVAERGLVGSPGVRVLVGEERHDTVDLALRYLGLGIPESVPADVQGRLDPAALRRALEEGDGRPTVVCLQAGNVHSGAFDAFPEAVTAAHDHGAWVHVDGAFGLWAAAAPAYRHLTEGMADADSWTTDAHKTLNVPYDSGLAIVRDAAALKAAMGMHGEYLVHSDEGEPLDKVPEVSRRGRAFPVWAALRSMGRSGVADLMDRLCGHASRMGTELAQLPGAEVLNDVVYTQVCVSFGDDETTRAVVARLFEDGSAWMTGSRWHGRAIMRVSVSNWSTTDDDVTRSLDAVRRAVEAVAAG